MPFRPFKTIEEMNQGLINNHNSVVKSNDIIIILGDFILGKDKYNTFPNIIPKLSGYKILLLGNHCLGFDDKREGKQEAAIKLYMDNGISKVYQGIVTLNQVLEDNNIPNPTTKNIELCHFPFFCDDMIHDNKYKHLMPIDTGQILFSGHTHQQIPIIRSRNINVGVDAHNYTPVSLINLLAQVEAFDKYPQREILT